VKYACCTLFILLFTGQTFASQWYEDYDKALGKLKKGNLAEAEALLLSALQKNPKPDIRSRPYGTITLEYIPHYYLAQCAFQKGDLAKAAEYLKQASLYRTDQSSVAKEFSELKTKVETQGKALESGIVIVVNPENKLSDITSAELKEIYLGNKTNWDSGTQITPVLYPAGSRLNDFFLNKICGMDEKAFTTYWESRSGAKTTPMFVDQDDWVLRYLERSPGAIGFMGVDKSGPLRVLKLNGKDINSAGYILSGN
jgi:tetratricopeptide (TPR) repeat protein